MSTTSPTEVMYFPAIPDEHGVEMDWGRLFHLEHEPAGYTECRVARAGEIDFMGTHRRVVVGQSGQGTITVDGVTINLRPRERVHIPPHHAIGVDPRPILTFGLIVLPEHAAP